jgi:AraC-like DNA-binding protein
MEIPLVRARYAHSFAKALDDLGVPTLKLLEANRLSPDLVNHQDGLITAHQLWAFAGHAAQQEGIAELGLLAGQVPVVEHGNFGKMVYQALTLYDAIKTFCDNAKNEYSRADFYLTQDERQAWFCRGPIDGDDAMQRQQVELYVLIMMIDTIRLGAGSQWFPTTLYLQNDDHKGLADIPLFRNADTRFGCKATAIGLPLNLLGRPLEGDIAAFAKAKNETHDILQNADFGKTLRYVLKNYIRFSHVSLYLTAEILGMTPRTLQRQLKNAGLTFQEVIDQLRYELALPLLKDKQHNLLDVALELRYSDAAHFTRAFRRWSGMSPREYRRRHCA